MYHVKQDPRASVSANLIYGALAQLLEVKPFGKLTVTEVLIKSTVSRATFYRSFDHLLDVLHWKFDTEFALFVETFVAKLELAKGPLDSDSLTLHYFNFWFNHREILNILYRTGHTDLIYSAFFNQSKPLTRVLLPDFSMEDEEYDYFVAVRAGTMLGILIQWISSGMIHTPEEISRILTNNANRVKNTGIKI